VTDLEDALFAAATTFALIVLASSPALAHTGSMGGDFISGFAHPLLGPDHMVAMVAVGLWGTFLGVPAVWILPVVFPAVMAVGGIIAIVGATIPYVEVAVALSAIVLGGMVAL